MIGIFFLRDGIISFKKKYINVEKWGKKYPYGINIAQIGKL